MKPKGDSTQGTLRSPTVGTGRCCGSPSLCPSLPPHPRAHPGAEATPPGSRGQSTGPTPRRARTGPSPARAETQTGALRPVGPVGAEGPEAGSERRAVVRPAGPAWPRAASASRGAQMEGGLLRCQPVSWIKMTHLFTQEPHKVLLRTGRGALPAL